MFTGAPDRIRTCDPCLRRATLIDGVNRGIWGKGARIARDRIDSGLDSTG